MSNKILFCNIAYTKFYDLDKFDEVPQNGGSYVKENKRANESNNFHVCDDGKVRGFVETKYRDGVPNQLRIENIDSSFKGNDRAEPVDVVFCAFSNSIKRTVVVGWYKDATVLRGREYYNGMVYNIFVDGKNAHLVPEEERTMFIPRASTDGVGFGQSNVWYANTPESEEIVSKVRGLIYSDNSSENTILRDLYEDISKHYPSHNLSIEISEDSLLVDDYCRIDVLEECYKISNVPSEWKQSTTYLTNEESDDTVYYFVDTYEECVGEVLRIISAFQGMNTSATHEAFRLNDIYSSVKFLEKEFPNVVISNVTNAGIVENCAYFKDKRIIGEKNDRILHIWRSHDNLNYFVQKILCTEEENIEAKGNPKTSANVNQLFIDGSDDQISFIREKLKKYFELKP